MTGMIGGGAWAKAAAAAGDESRMIAQGHHSNAPSGARRPENPNRRHRPGRCSYTVQRPRLPSGVVLSNMIQVVSPEACAASSLASVASARPSRMSIATNGKSSPSVTSTKGVVQHCPQPGGHLTPGAAAAVSAVSRSSRS
eukprot:scaffold29236_cov120-Isochrysis_galbana.AAC.5